MVKGREKLWPGDKEEPPPPTAELPLYYVIIRTEGLKIYTTSEIYS